MKSVMEDYASRVKFRAYVHAKNHVSLKKLPKDTSSVRFFYGGVEIPGNTGSPTDKWYYDGSKNEVTIRWYLLDLGQVKPGDQIKIEYRVS
jgi:hypothetical protein